MLHSPAPLSTIQNRWQQAFTLSDAVSAQAQTSCMIQHDDASIMNRNWLLQSNGLVIAH